MALSVVNPIRGYDKEVINEGVDTWQHPEGSVSACLGGQQCPFLCFWVLSTHVKAEEFHEPSAQ